MKSFGFWFRPVAGPEPITYFLNDFLNFPIGILENVINIRQSYLCDLLKLLKCLTIFIYSGDVEPPIFSIRFLKLSPSFIFTCTERLYKRLIARRILPHN